MNNVSRFPDRGRGQGLKGMKAYVAKRRGIFSVRSGTARIALIPAWDDDQPLLEDLTYFPGAQLLMMIPEELGPAA